MIKADQCDVSNRDSSACQKQERAVKHKTCQQPTQVVFVWIQGSFPGTYIAKAILSHDLEVPNQVERLAESTIAIRPKNPGNVRQCEQRDDGIEELQQIHPHSVFDGTFFQQVLNIAFIQAYH